MDELFFDKVRFISSKRAALLSGYAPDYIGQLCRSGKLRGRLVGRTWYVDERSIHEHEREVERLLKEEAKERSSVSRAQGKSTHFAKEPSQSSPGLWELAPTLNTALLTKACATALLLVVVFNSGASIASGVSVPDLKGVAQTILLPIRTVASAVVSNTTEDQVFAEFDAGALPDGSLEHVGTKLSSIPEHSARFVARIVTATYEKSLQTASALSSGETLARSVYHSLSQTFDATPELFSNVYERMVLSAGPKTLALEVYRTLNGSFDSLRTYLFPESLRVAHLEGESEAGKATTTVALVEPVEPSSPEAPIQTTFVQPVVERIVERAVAAGYTVADIDAKLNALDNKLTAKLYEVSAREGDSALRQSTQVISQATRIDSLNNADISNASITGSSFSGTSISGTSLSITGTGTSTFSGGIELSGGCFAINGTCVGSGGGGASAFTDLSDTQSSLSANRIIFTNSAGTALTDSSSLTFDGTKLITPYASSTAQTISGTLYLATSLNGPLQANDGTVSATTTIDEVYGGTGQTTYATGDLLYASAANTLSRLSIGTAGQVLQVLGGVPVWGAASGGGSSSTNYWATSTDDLVLSPVDTDHVLVIGASATTTEGNILEVAGSAQINNALTVTGQTTLGNASTTVLSVSGATYLSTSLNGPLQANGGAVTATTSVGVLYGGTGLTSAPAYGQVLLGNALNGYTLTATSSLGFLLSELDDVSFTTPAYGNLLSYNGTQWVNFATTSLGVALSDTTGTLSVSKGGTGLSSTPTYGQILLGNGSTYTLSATSSLGVDLSDTTGSLADSRVADALTISGGTINNTPIGASSASTAVFTTSTSTNLNVFGGSLIQVGGSSASNYTLSALGDAELSVNVSDVFVSGRYAYVSVGAFTNNFRIYDISTSTPALVSEITLPNSTTAAASMVSGDYAYIGSTSNAGNELYIYNIANPSSPVSIGGINVGSSVTDIFALGRYAYVVTGSSLLIYDVSNPSSVKLLSSTSASASYIHVQGSFAYTVGQSSSGNDLIVFDISNPDSPSILGGADLGSTDLGGKTGVVYATGNSIFVSGTHAYVGKDQYGLSNEFLIYDVSIPGSPALVGGIDFGSITVGEIQISGTYAYVGANTMSGNDFRVYDVQNPKNPVLIGGAEIAATVSGIAVSGNRAYITSNVNSGGTELKVFDITGINVQSALVHSLEAGRVQIHNSLSVSGGGVFDSLNTGIGGLFSRGGIFSYVASSTAERPVAAAFLGGNVGVGTTSPFAKLSVTGSGTGTGLAFQVADSANAPKFTILDNGNVGIGTTSPFAKLSVVGIGSFDDYVRASYFVGTSTATSTFAGGLSVLAINQTGVASSTFTNGIDLAGGCFSINGTCVGGGAGASTFLSLTDTPSSFTANRIIFTNSGGTALTDSSGLTFDGTKLTSSYASTTALSTSGGAWLATAGGSVGIGTTSPFAKLSVTGSGTGTGAAFQVANSSDVPKFTILDNGDVGIGTASPFAKLAVLSSGLSQTWAEIGTELSVAVGAPALATLSPNRVAFFDSNNDALRTYEFNGSTWTEIGTEFSAVGAGFPALAALSPNRVAFVGPTNEDLRLYEFNGSTWAQIGTELSIASMGDPALAALSPNRVAFIDGTNDDLRVYEFNGSTWTEIGTELNIASVGTYPALAALSPNRVAFIDDTNDDLRVYEFNGSTWSEIGTELNITGVGTFPALTTLSSNRIAFIDTDNDDLRVYEFNGSTWSGIGTELNIAGTSFPALATLSPNRVAFIDSNNDAFRVYQFSSPTFFVGNDSSYPYLSVSDAGYTTAESLSVRTELHVGQSATSTTASSTPALTVWGDASFLSDGTFLGNVGVGTSTPWTRLSVTDTVSTAQVSIAYDATRYATFQVNSSGDLIVDPQGDDAFLLDDNLWVCTGGSCPANTPSGTGNLIVENRLGVGTTTPTEQLSVTGKLYVGADGAAGLGTATSTFQGDIRILGKLDVSTIDPVYTISGIKYATYGHATIGIHEEVVTNITLQPDGAGEYTYAVAFSKLPKGSDLWLFYQVTNFGSAWEDLVVSLTPGFDGSVSYRKDPEKNELVVVGTKPGEVGMRLIANRHDASSWPNLRPDQEDPFTNFTLDEK